MIDADHANDLSLLANALTEAESLPYSLEQAAEDSDFLVNANKTEYMHFK